jgi:hypothetical protein
MTTRREFIGASAALLAAGSVSAAAKPGPASHKLDILFLRSAMRSLADIRSACSIAAVTAVFTGIGSKN